MNPRIPFWVMVIVLFSSLCAGAPASEPLWSWVKGNNLQGFASVYGTCGVASPANRPGHREDSALWTDKFGKLWLFGGRSYRYGANEDGSDVFFNDLWRFDPATGLWTWVKGSNQPDQAGVYGTPGVAAPVNTPGARRRAANWTDAAGRLWLFGGNNFNDLWSFDPATGNWTWIKGSDQPNQRGIYGTQGIPDPANTPGARRDAAVCIDAAGRFWLFGGDEAGNYFDDLWCFDPATGNWTWLKGSYQDIPAGVYGTKGVPDPANQPGGRAGSVNWTGKDGRLWLFGGTFSDKSLTSHCLNDLWSYDPSSGNWTWVAGSDHVDQGGVYGAQGVAAPANTPGARREACAWTDASGGLWLFGGTQDPYWFSSFNDLWRFEPATGFWTWVKGSDQTDQPGFFSTLGVTDPANTPGARQGAAACTGSGGRFWLFGGHGVYSSPDYDYGKSDLNDLWSFDPAATRWTAVHGNNALYASGVYGTAGTPAPANTPGARQSAAAWSDAAGRLYFMGGLGEDSTHTVSCLNDLWRFESATGNWTWLKGSAAGSQAGVYGSLGMPAPANTPGGRVNAATWTDAAGRLWLFGGDEGGVGAGCFNDLWRFDPTTNNWTWLKGGNGYNQDGVYGTQGTPAPANTPGARCGAATWIDKAGRLWLFGGALTTHGSGGRQDNRYLYNDLWRYDPVTNNWTWVKGSDQINQAGVYGARGIPAPDNTPGARTQAASWIDRSGRLWLFGGLKTGGASNYNDLWVFDPATNNWTWIKGSDKSYQKGVYSASPGLSSPDSTPGGRLGAAAWTDANGRPWLLGGWGVDAAGKSGLLNDLWSFDAFTGNWIWHKGSKLRYQYGVYGSRGGSAPANTPGGRYGAAAITDVSGRLWLFGGQGLDAKGYMGYLNDLWMLTVPKNAATPAAWRALE